MIFNVIIYCKNIKNGLLVKKKEKNSYKCDEKYNDKKYLLFFLLIFINKNDKSNTHDR